MVARLAARARRLLRRRSRYRGRSRGGWTRRSPGTSTTGGCRRRGPGGWSDRPVSSAYRAAPDLARPVLGHLGLGRVRSLLGWHLRILAVRRDLGLGGVGRV